MIGGMKLWGDFVQVYWIIKVEVLYVIVFIIG